MALPTAAGRCRAALLVLGAPAVLAAAARPAVGQSDSAARRAVSSRASSTSSSELTIDAGLSQRRQRDVTASPLVFDGSGFNAAARLTRPIGESLILSGEIAGGLSRLGSDATAAHERIIDGDASLSIDRRVLGDAATARGSLALGASLAADVSSNLHQYATAASPSAAYLMMSATIGPAAAWRAHVGPGRALVMLRAPLVGLVDHPYSEDKAGYTPVSFQTATPNALRRLDGVVQYTPDRFRRSGFTLDYRFSLLRYDDVQPLRAATQGLSLGLATWLGTPGRER
jgi:hypothetical protein